jgi:BirA family transcriptional regulator, biotin operon repressor / biotin---[acetyl-CoA-carboxylase] ligase
VRIAREAEAAGFRLVYREVTGSTNDDAVSALRGGDPGKLWIVGGTQTQGRGRHGRAWSSPAGNLYASLVLVDPCEMRYAAQLGYLVGLSLHDAITSLAPERAGEVRLKWPNDLLHEGAKIAGILLEGHRTPGGAFALIAGIGVNIVASPSDAPYPTSFLQRLAPSIDRENLFEALSRALALRYTRWREAADARAALAHLRAEWITRAAGLDQAVTIRLPSGPRHGIFTGLDHEGRLLLATETGIEAIDAGDLYFSGEAAPAPARAGRTTPGSDG